MSNVNNIKTFTKKQLLDCLKDDGIQADADTIYNAKRDDGEALYDIGFEYHNPGRDYSKALAWYQLAENQNYSPAYNNIGALYDGGFGEPRRIDIALGYYLKAAAEYDNDVALGNIGILLLYGGGGVPLDKYKALEWLAKSGEWHERVKALNHQGIHLKLQDTIHQLIRETEEMVRKERQKKNEECQDLKKLNAAKKKELAAKKKELTNLRKENKKLQNESQQKQQRIDSLEEQNQENTHETHSADLLLLLAQKGKTNKEILHALMQEKIEYQEFKPASEKELTNRQNEIQMLQNESQQKQQKQQRIDTLEQKEQQVQLRMDSLEQQSNTEKEPLKHLNISLNQQLKDKEENIILLKDKIEASKKSSDYLIYW